MHKIDFITAFGRLLRDGSLRDAYAKDPFSTADSLGVAIEERPAWLALNQDDLEFQAEVLLRKRFEAVSRLIPQTVANAGARAWPLFAEYARKIWPDADPPEVDDANRFCIRLDSMPDSFVPADERNRVRFAAGNASFAVHFVPNASVRNRRRPCLQIFLRTTGQAWREVLLYIG